MKIRLGIVGALDTVDKIKNVAKEFKDSVEIFIFSYEDKKEVSNLLENSKDKVDVYLFSGQVPYAVSEHGRAINKPSVYIPRTGTSLYKAFWQMKEQDIDYSKISFDTIEKNDIVEVTNELDININNLYVKTYYDDIDYHEIVNFHYKLWKEKKINVATTCLSTTYKDLMKLGVPVIKLYPTDSLIRECIKAAVYVGDAEKIKATQIAVQIFKIKNKNIILDYEFLKLKNMLEKTLLDYTQDCFGYVFPFGRDEYVMFSTRGAINNQWLNFDLSKSLNTYDNNVEIKVASGIGYGNTVYEAETKARIALGFAIEERYNSCYMVDENGKITGPMGQKEDNLSYDLAVMDEEVQLIAKKIQISATYISKIKALIQKIGTNRMSAEIFANYLGISERSGRRILKNITDAGYAKIIANESSSNVGRPRQVYEILL